MANNTQSLTTDVQSWEAFHERMYNNCKFAATDKNPAPECYKPIPKPCIQVVVIDPNSFYSSESENSDSGCGSDVEINSETEPIDSRKSAVPTLKPNKVERHPTQNSSPSEHLVKQAQPDDMLADFHQKPISFQKPEVQTSTLNEIKIHPTVKPTSSGQPSVPVQQPEPTCSQESFQKPELQTSTLNEIKIHPTIKPTSSEQPSVPVQQPEPTCSQKSEVFTMKSNEVESRPSLQTSEQPVNKVQCDEPLDPIEEPVELIDGLFDFVTLNPEDEDVLLEEMKSFDNNNFDLAAYVTDQSESPITSPASTTEDNKNHGQHSEDLATHSEELNFTSDSYRRKTLKRQFLGDSSDSEDDGKKVKISKVDNDPSWMPSERQKNKQKQPINNKSVSNRDGIRYGVGRGKNFAELSKHFNRSTSNCDNKKNRSVNHKTASSKTVNDVKEHTQKIGISSSAQISVNKVNKKTAKSMAVNELKEQSHKLERNSSDQKKENKVRERPHNKVKRIPSDTKKSKDLEINNNAANLSDFERAILCSMAIQKMKRKQKRKRIVQKRKIQFQEHSEKFRQYLSDKAAKAKILQENVRRVTISKFGNNDNVESEKTSVQDRKVDVENKIIKTEEEPKKRIGIHEYLQRIKKSPTPILKIDSTQTKAVLQLPTSDSTQTKDVLQLPTSDASDPNIVSNVKRKISVNEYFKRKAMVQSA